jgi:hypothetical protein
MIRRLIYWWRLHRALLKASAAVEAWLATVTRGRLTREQLDRMPF